MCKITYTNNDCLFWEDSRPEEIIDTLSSLYWSVMVTAATTGITLIVSYIWL